MGRSVKRQHRQKNCDVLPRSSVPYDNNGNATQLLLDGAVMFTYHDNAQDRLVGVEDVNGGTIAENAYDPLWAAIVEGSRRNQNLLLLRR